MVSSAALGLMSEGHRRIFQPVNCERSSNCLQDSHNLTTTLGIQQCLSFNKHTFTNLTAAVSSYMKQAVFIQPVRSMCEHVSPTLYRGQRCTRCTSLNMNLGSPKETPHNQDCFRKRVRSKNLLKLTEVLFSLSRVRAASAAHLDHT